MNRYLLSTLTLSLMAAFSHAAEADKTVKAPIKAAGAPHAISGIDLQYIEPTVRAQDDFFQHFSGKWLTATEIPADKSSWGAFAKLRDDTTPQLRAIIEDAAKHKITGADAKKIGDMYASYMDEKKLDALGTKPLAGEIGKIAALGGKQDIPAMIGHLSTLGVGMPYGVGVGQDSKDSTKYAVSMGQGGLGMPDRDYYLSDDAKMSDTRAKYQLHIEKILTLAGDTNAAANAKAVVALETELAKVQWTRVANRDPVKRYNKIEVSKLDTLTPGYDWKAYFGAVGLDGKMDSVIVGQPSFMTGFNTILQATPLETWKAYFQWHLLRTYSAALSKPFADETFAFYGTVMSGVTEQQPRWKRGVASVERNLGEAVGKLYVQRHFPAERKARMESMVKNILAAYKESIDTLDWMSPETKKEAQAKLAKFTPKIGYTNKWRDYSKLDIKADDLVGNLMRSAKFERDDQISRLGQPIDREKWGMTPQTVNAYYNPSMNEIVFPASILQPPFFDAKADDAVNYGGIGAVIGHEISHGFDDQGSQFDGDGNLRNWWTESDRKNFSAKTKMLIDQYSAFSPVPGFNVNGALTLGENIADNSGLAIAYKAYKISLKGKPAPVINGLTGDQRLFMGWSQVWRSKAREAAEIAQLKSDPHSPGKYRTNGTLRNQPPFYDAFGIKEGDKMYLAPKDRVIIW